MNTNYIETILERGIKLNHEEIEVVKIASKFDSARAKYTKQYKNSIIIGNKLKESNNWKTFENFYKFSQEQKNLNTDLFIESQFYWAKKLDRLCVPSWLGTENSVIRYFKFLELWNSKPKDSSYAEIYLESLQYSIRFVYNKMCELGTKTLEELFEYRSSKAGVPKSFLWVENGSIGYTFLSISKSYPKFLRHLEADVRQMYPKVEDLKDIRQFIVLHAKLNNFCRAVIENEINF